MRLKLAFAIFAILSTTAHAVTLGSCRQDLDGFDFQDRLEDAADPTGLYTYGGLANIRVSLKAWCLRHPNESADAGLRYLAATAKRTGKIPLTHRIGH